MNIEQPLKTVTTKDGKSSFNYTQLYDPAIISACMAWFGSVNLESLFETIDRWDQGARPINTKTTTYSGQVERHGLQDSMLIVERID